MASEKFNRRAEYMLRICSKFLWWDLQKVVLYGPQTHDRILRALVAVIQGNEGAYMAYIMYINVYK